MYDVMKDILMSEKEFTGTNYKRYEFDRMYIDKKLIEDQLYQIKYQFNEKKNYIYKVLFNTLKQNASTL